MHTHPGVIAHSAGDDELTAALLLGHELGTCTCRDQTDEMDETREDMHVVDSRLNRRAVAEAGPLCETSFHSAALISVTLPGHLLRAESSHLAHDCFRHLDAVKADDAYGERASENAQRARKLILGAASVER